MSRPAVHPFPARMAPEVVDERILRLRRDSVVLDPMMGSGTFPVTAASCGHTAYGCDSDPLAVLIARTSAGYFDIGELVAAGGDIIIAAKRNKSGTIPRDPETRAFIDYWFDPAAQDKLAALADAIPSAPAHLHAPLWCAFSRLIITKDNGVSLARDVSHSRPHRVRDVATVDAIEQFAVAVGAVARRAPLVPLSGNFVPLRADARSIPLREDSVDAVMTSPPYLVAIDYLRGHRLSLVWMGYSLGELRVLRRENVGSEAGSDAAEDLDSIVRRCPMGQLPNRGQRVLNRYAQDVDRVISEIARVLKPSGTASFVVADARLAGVGVSIERLVCGLAKRHGLRRASRNVRAIPSQRRYLPPPDSGTSALALRMRNELILTFTHA